MNILFAFTLLTCATLANSAYFDSHKRDTIDEFVQKIIAANTDIKQ